MVWGKKMTDDFRFDRQLAAAALGVDLSTLPSAVSPGEPVKPAASNRSISHHPLTDGEWTAIEQVLPKLPVLRPDTDFNTRVFLNSVIWFSTAMERGIGWGKLPDEYRPTSSREHRHRRWCELGWWRKLSDALARHGLLSEARRQTFERIAVDGERRRQRLFAARERLTGAR